MTKRFLEPSISIMASSRDMGFSTTLRVSTTRARDSSSKPADASLAPPFSSARFEPLLNDRALAVFELPDDEIVGGRLVLMARGSLIMDSTVYFAAPATLPERQPMLRLEQ